MDLTIPVYAGAYDMAKDSAQAEMDGVRYEILRTVLGHEEYMEVQYRLQRAGRETGDHPSVDEITAAQIAAATPLIAGRLDTRNAAGWSVAELIERFERLRAQVCA